jgi:hypothetical protein
MGGEHQLVPVHGRGAIVGHDARIVDEHLQARLALGEVASERTQGVQIADVAARRAGIGAGDRGGDPGDRLVRARLRAGQRVDGCPKAGEADRRGKSQSAGGPCDQVAPSIRGGSAGQPGSRRRTSSPTLP